jgi:hypothetical protein
MKYRWRTTARAERAPALQACTHWRTSRGRPFSTRPGVAIVTPRCAHCHVIMSLGGYPSPSFVPYICARRCVQFDRSRYISSAS